MLRFAPQVSRIASFYPLPSGKLDHSPMQKPHRRELIINWLHTWNFGFGPSRITVGDSMDISPLAFWISDSPDHLILSTVGRQMYPRCTANFASNNEMSNRLYQPKLR